MQITTAPWPWTLLVIPFGIVFIAALIVAWRSADRVVAENRARTRARRIFVACIPFPLTFGGIAFPIGAVYALMAYTPKKKRPPTRVSRQTAAWLGVEADE